jgi:hypothetical protein
VKPCPKLPSSGRGSLCEAMRTTNSDWNWEADKCRQKALAYFGRPEAPFLLRVAREFDRLAQDDRPAAAWDTAKTGSVA